MEQQKQARQDSGQSPFLNATKEYGSTDATTELYTDATNQHGADWLCFPSRLCGPGDVHWTLRFLDGPVN